MAKGRACRDFVSLKTLFLNLKKIIKKNNPYIIYNFASSYSFSIKEIVKIVKKHAEKIKKKKISINFGKIKDKKNTFRVFSKLNLYKSKLDIIKELNCEIKKILNLINEKKNFNYRP